MNGKLLIVSGVQRSGNSLLAKLLGNHSSIEMEVNPSLTTVLNSHRLLLDNVRNCDLGTTEFVQESISENLSHWHPDRLAGFDFSAWHASIVPDYVDSRLAGTNAGYLGMKIPDYCNRLEEIDFLDKNCKFISISRDPRNVVSSQMAKINKDIIDAVNHWKYSFFKSSYYAVTLGPDRFMSVKFEDLLIDPEKELRRLCAFLDLQFEHNMITLDVGTNREDGSYILPKFEESKLFAFRDTLQRRQIKTIESLCYREMQHLGLKFDQITKPGRDITKIELLSSKLINDFANLFVSNKKHMSDNRISSVDVPLVKRTKQFARTLASIVLPKALLDVITRNDRLT